MQRIVKYFIISLLLVFSCSLYANVSSIKHVVVAPHCLLKATNLSYKTLSSTNHLILTEVNDAGIDSLIEAKERLSRSDHPCGGFMDVSKAWHEYKSKDLTQKSKARSFLSNYDKAAKKSATVAYSIRYPNQVNQLLKQLNPQRMWDRLVALTSYSDRSALTWNGVNAATEIKAEVESIARANGRNDVSAFFVGTGDYMQPSVVVKIGNSNLPGIVVGAHIDTFSPAKPGADDDGTGTVTVLELARVLLTSGMTFNKPIYLAFYAAEERGLVGSQWVVREFKRKNIPVSEVMQLDMTGYAYNNDMTMWLMDDYVDASLNAFIETLINTYVKIPVKHSRCGYACSDHASWTQGGYPASMPFESSMSTYNPYIHTSNDTMEKLSLTHMTHFASMAIAFAVELAEPTA